MTWYAVLGGGPGVWADLQGAREALGPETGVLACNDAGAAYSGPLRAFCTLHPAKLPAWLHARQAAGHPAPAETFAHKAMPGVGTVLNHRRHWPGGLDVPRSGSSGLFAAQVALAIGANRIVLCGIPMSVEVNAFHGAKWMAAVHYRRAWDIARPVLLPACRSMSGWTREILGAPTLQWASAGCVADEVHVADQQREHPQGQAQGQ